MISNTVRKVTIASIMLITLTIGGFMSPVVQWQSLLAGGPFESLSVWDAAVLCKTDYAKVDVLDEDGDIALDCWSVMFVFTVFVMFGIIGIAVRIGAFFRIQRITGGDI